MLAINIYIVCPENAFKNVNTCHLIAFRKKYWLQGEKFLSLKAMFVKY
jgi:hypothetical protein